MLCPVLSPGRVVPVVGTPEGRVFTEQRVVVRPTPNGVQVLLPVTTRGDRFGVLVLDRAAGPDAATTAELADLAVALAHEVRAVDETTDRFRLARRRDRLTLAAEIQWALLPGRSIARPELTLAGNLEPAYAVRGDNYDWSSEAGHVTVTMTNGHGDGIEAALLTVLATTAVRNARLAGAGLADQASLADQAIYAQHRGGRHISMVLLRVDLATGRVAAVDAGSPVLLRVRGDAVGPVALEPQLPLGMFESTVYREQEFALVPGDRLFVLSDGVHDSPYADRRYGEHGRLRQTVTATRKLSAAEAVRAVFADHAVFRQGQPLDDDAAVLCLDWHGTG